MRDIESIAGRVNAIIVSVLGVESDKVMPHARLREDLGANEDDMWALMLKLEDELDIPLMGWKYGDPSSWLTVGDAINACECGEAWKPRA